MARIKTLPKVLIGGIITVAAGFGINSMLERAEKNQKNVQAEPVAVQTQIKSEPVPIVAPPNQIPVSVAPVESTTSNAGLSKLLQSGGK